MGRILKLFAHGSHSWSNLMTTILDHYFKITLQINGPSNQTFRKSQILFLIQLEALASFSCIQCITAHITWTLMLPVSELTALGNTLSTARKVMVPAVSERCVHKMPRPHGLNLQWVACLWLNWLHRELAWHPVDKTFSRPAFPRGPRVQVVCWGCLHLFHSPLSIEWASIS